MASDDDTSITKQILNLVLETKELKVFIGTWTGLLLMIFIMNIYMLVKITS